MMHSGNATLRIDEELTPDDCMLLHVAVPGFNLTMKVSREQAYDIASDLVRPFILADLEPKKGPSNGTSGTTP